MRSERMIHEAARRSGPVTVRYLPGFAPPDQHDATRFPFDATINGELVTVHRLDGEIVFERIEDGPTFDWGEFD